MSKNEGDVGKVFFNILPALHSNARYPFSFHELNMISCITDIGLDHKESTITLVPCILGSTTTTRSRNSYPLIQGFPLKLHEQ